eukprot:COSAG01_NODE_581_length_15195_cov_16.315291_5_plen_407_part_00
MHVAQVSPRRLVPSRRPRHGLTGATVGAFLDGPMGGGGSKPSDQPRGTGMSDMSEAGGVQQQQQQQQELEHEAEAGQGTEGGCAVPVPRAGDQAGSSPSRPPCAHDLDDSHDHEIREHQTTTSSGDLNKGDVVQLLGDLKTTGLGEDQHPRAGQEGIVLATWHPRRPRAEAAAGAAESSPRDERVPGLAPPASQACVRFSEGGGEWYDFKALVLLRRGPPLPRLYEGPVWERAGRLHNSHQGAVASLLAERDGGGDDAMEGIASPVKVTDICQGLHSNVQNLTAKPKMLITDLLAGNSTRQSVASAGTSPADWTVFDAMLFKAAAMDDVENLTSAISFGANLTMVNTKGQTVFELAKERDSKRVMAWRKIKLLIKCSCCARNWQWLMLSLRLQWAQRRWTRPCSGV